MTRLYFIFIVLITINLFSQQNNPYILLNTENNLPSNKIYNIYKDSDEYLYFLTERGIVKFNGLTFINLNKSLNLKSWDYHTLFFDSKNRVWFMAKYQSEIEFLENNKVGEIKIKKKLPITGFLKVLSKFILF